MPPAEVQAAAGGGQGQQGQQQQPGQSLLTMILRMAMMYYVMSWLRGPQNQQAGPAGVAHHVFRRGELVDTYLYISESQYLNDRSEGTLVWQESGIPLGTTTERLLETTYVPSKVSSVWRPREARMFLFPAVVSFGRVGMGLPPAPRALGVPRA